jgi:uncharacterized protein YndB with AHSA1/START domain
MSVLRMTRVVPAPAEEVFRAWTDPAVLRLWWGPGEHQLKEVEADARPGGTYRFEVTAPEGFRYVIAGDYIEVDPPRRLSFTWRFVEGGPDEHTSRVTVELEPRGEQTELRLTHDRFPTDEAAAPYARGWEQTLPNFLALFD